MAADESVRGVPPADEPQRSKLERIAEILVEIRDDRRGAVEQLERRVADLEARLKDAA